MAEINNLANTQQLFGVTPQSLVNQNVKLPPVELNSTLTTEKPIVAQQHFVKLNPSLITETVTVTEKPLVLDNSLSSSILQNMGLTGASTNVVQQQPTLVQPAAVQQPTMVQPAAVQQPTMVQPAVIQQPTVTQLSQLLQNLGNFGNISDDISRQALMKQNLELVKQLVDPLAQQLKNRDSSATSIDVSQQDSVKKSLEFVKQLIDPLAQYLKTNKPSESNQGDTLKQNLELAKQLSDSIDEIRAAENFENAKKSSDPVSTYLANMKIT